MQERKEKNILITGIAFLFLFSLALIFPEKLWGIHFYTFLSTKYVIGLIFVAALTLLWFYFKPIQQPPKFLSNTKTVVILTIVAGWIFHSFPIHDDFYGDANLYKELLRERVETLDVKRTNNLYSLQVLDPKNGEKTVLNAVEKIAYYSKAKVVDVFRWIGTISGVCFLLLWSFFITYYFENKKTQLVLIVLAFCAPFLQLFFGHVEIYAPSIASISAYLAVLLIYFKTPKRKLLWVLGVLFFTSLKFHFAAILLFPSLVFSIIYRYKREQWNHFFKWETVFKTIILPVLVFGWLAYFFWFKDYNDPRFLDGVIKDAERLFLPIISPEAPLDRYNLFSLNHLLDYANMFFLWSGAGLFLGTIFILNRKEINWNKPEIIVLGTTLIFFVCLFFMINPLLSMPMDWDLFSIPAPVFLFFLVVVFKQVETKKWTKSLLGPILAISLFSLPIYYTNYSPKENKERLKKVGEHVFKTYWIRSAGDIMAGLDEHQPNYINNLEETISYLKPNAVKGNDVEYANLLMNAGKYYRRNNQEQKGLQYHLQAFDYAPNFPTNYIGIMESYYRLAQFDNALMFSEKLIDAKYPSELDALNIAIDCALQAKKYEKALDYCNQYLTIEFNDDINDTRLELVQKGF